MIKSEQQLITPELGKRTIQYAKTIIDSNRYRFILSQKAQKAIERIKRIK